jgi:hypothetical protein
MSEKSKTMDTQMLAIKKEKKRKRKRKKERKDSPCSLAKVSKFQTRKACFKEHSRIRIATIYISHTCTS